MAIFSEKIALLIEANTGGAVTPLKQLEGQARKTDTAWDKAAKSIGVSGQALKTGLVAGAAALVGTGLVTYLNQSVAAYANAAKAAGDLANATGSSTEDVSRLTAALGDAGVGADQAASLLTKFTTNAGKNAELIADLGVTMVQNADGSVDYAQSLVATVDAVDQMGDAAARNTALVQLFGKQGAAAFNDLRASGVSLADAMAQIDSSRVFSEEDRRRAAEYDDAIDSMHASMQGIQNTLGRTLVPAITGLTNALVPAVEVLADVPGEVYLVVGAMVALNVAMKSQLIANVGNTALAFVGLTQSLGVVRAGMLTTAAASEALTAALVANPVTAVLVALTASIAAFIFISGKIDDNVDEAVAGLRDLEKQGLSTAEAIDKTAEKLEANQNVITGFVAGFRENLGRNVLSTIFAPTAVVNAVRLLTDAFKDGGADADFYSQQLAKVAEEEGNMAALSADAVVQQRELADLIAEGGHSQSELATAAREAAEAQEKQAAATRAANDAMDAAIVTTDELATATLALFDADIAHDRARFARADAVKEAVKLAKDENASRRDVAESILKVREASLQAAQAYVAEKTAALEAGGAVVTEADKRLLLVESLKRQLATIPKSLPEARAAMQELIKGLEGAETGPITIGGIQFKPGTTEKEIDGLKTKLDEAIRTHDWGAQVKIQEQLDALKMPPMPVTLTGPNGAPLGEDVGVKVVMDTTQVEATRATMAELSGSKEVLYFMSTVGASSVESITNVLDADHEVLFYLSTAGAGNVESILDALEFDREVIFFVSTSGAGNVESILDALDRDRYVTVHVSETGGGSAGGGGGVAQRNVGPAAMQVLMAPQFSPTVGPGLQALTPTGPEVLGFSRTTEGGFTYSPTIINQYPAPERASDTIAMSLRMARYM